MKLLIVDDIDTNRKVLRVRFEAEGHTPIEARDGVEALQILSSEKVDVVLSDILMPRMDGYRLCHEIRTNDRLCGVPIVIYTSTYTQASDEKLALGLGADKYLKKPAPFEAILSALHDAIAMQHTAPPPGTLEKVEVLKEYSNRLVTKLEERNIELAEANERLSILDRSKSEFLNLISHEFRTPLNGLLGVSELVLDGMSPTMELRGLFDRSRQRILSILDDAVLLAQIDVSGEQLKISTSVSLAAVLERALESTSEFARSRGVALSPPPAQSAFVLGDEDLLEKAFHALLETAVKFSETGETVRLSCDALPDSQRVMIECRGRTIPVPAFAKFWELFSIGEASTPGGDLGLGPPVAYRILSLLGGSVSVANRVPSGIRLTISLKNASAPSPEPLNASLAIASFGGRT